MPARFARGFTTGPDVFGITINKTTGQISVNLDARVNAVARFGIGVRRRRRAILPVHPVVRRCG